MFDTYVTIVGNVLTAPEWRRTTQSGTLVANFKVASTARRLDRESGRWVDGNSLRVRVNCWRKLAEGVASSVMVGDPVVVVGRLYTRDWTDDAGNHRTMYELEAVAVGHDLSRGRGRFARNRPSMATSSMEEAEAEARVHGETTESVSPEEAPVLPDERPLDDDEYRGLPVPPGQDFGSAHLPADPFDGRIDLDGPPDGDVTDPAEAVTPPTGAAYGPRSGDEGRDGIDAVDVEDGEIDLGANGGDEDDQEFRDENDADTADRGAGRGRRGRGRLPVSV
ncbi:single-stranded DNA-binding protein [Plantactinospora sp. ZYX-F-223]|uniref:single-stranded DNA-binding protein n=1 Tax=Plantactinospora sp. ZYX-F-223 TaxID=3144103 RepID=UPI0031FD42D5